MLSVDSAVMTAVPIFLAVICPSESIETTSSSVEDKLNNSSFIKLENAFPNFIISSLAICTKFIKIFVGLIYVLLGVAIFLAGAEIGFWKIGQIIGLVFGSSDIKWLIIPIGMVIGFVIVKAEPAVAVLTEQIEKITEGSIKGGIMKNVISFGVSIAVGISIFRVITGVSITYFLFFGYLLAIILMIFSPDIFTMVAFDSGGAVTGPMTTTFLLPLIIGICYACGGDVLTSGFGLVALVALSPLIVIQILGIIYSVKSKKKKQIDNIDESIVEFKRSDQVG